MCFFVKEVKCKQIVKFKKYKAALQEYDAEVSRLNEKRRNTRKRCKMFKALVVNITNQKEELM